VPTTWAPFDSLARERTDETRYRDELDEPPEDNRYREHHCHYPIHSGLQPYAYGKERSG
jgi:hypothetical protein